MESLYGDGNMSRISKKQRKGKETKLNNLALSYEISFYVKRHQARSLSPENGFIKETGWTINATISEDYYRWINDFDAFHPVHGRVAGNFESIVRASSEKAYEQFIKDHPYEEWDYGDI